MARTLIGNIKGKDGRGISKVEKTATTGVVDTYTITYTDGTKSTFEIRNSDDIAIQRQIVPSAAVESSSIASQAYAAGDYVVVSGVLRKVTSAIAKGNTISDSNSAATTVSGELATIGDSVSKARSGIVTAKYNDIEVIGFERAGIAVIHVSRWGQSGNALVPAVGDAALIGTIAAVYRPATYWQTPIGLDAGIVEACPDGRLIMYSLDGQSRGVAEFRCTITYPVGC
jgi:hypothetical protein